MAVLAFVTNFGPTELLVIAALAVILFGKRLPEAAAQVYTQFRRFRESFDRLRRESGIEREMREIEYTVREAARKAALKIELEAPAEERKERDEGETPVAEDEAADAAEAETDADEGSTSGEDGSAPELTPDRRETS